MLRKAFIALLCVAVLLAVSCGSPANPAVQDAGANQENPAGEDPSGEPSGAKTGSPDSTADEDDEEDTDDDDDEDDPGDVEDPDQGEGSGAVDQPGGGGGTGAGQGSGDDPGSGNDPGDGLTGSAAVQEYLDGLEGNTETTPYLIKVGGIDLSKRSAGNALKGLYLALSRFVTLDLSGSYGEIFANVAPKTAQNKDKIIGIILPPGLYTIDVNAFVGYENLVSADLSGVTTIVNGAFNGCAKLETLAMEEVTKITDATSSGKGVFQGCDSLVSVSLPKAAEIGIRAFAGCANLNHIVLGETPPALGAAVFAEGKPEAIYVPESAIDTYKNTDRTGWTEALKAKVQPMP
jgi:hypothetical protein